MDILTLRAFFMWCTIMNGGLLVLSATMVAFAPDFVYSTQSRWFPLSRDVIAVAIYSYLGLFKIFFLIFNLVPYIALLIIG